MCLQGGHHFWELSFSQKKFKCVFSKTLVGVFLEDTFLENWLLCSVLSICHYFLNLNGPRPESLPRAPTQIWWNIPLPTSSLFILNEYFIGRVGRQERPSSTLDRENSFTTLGGVAPFVSKAKRREILINFSSGRGPKPKKLLSSAPHRITFSAHI